MLSPPNIYKIGDGKMFATGIGYYIGEKHGDDCYVCFPFKSCSQLENTSNILCIAFEDLCHSGQWYLNRRREALTFSLRTLYGLSALPNTYVLAL